MATRESSSAARPDAVAVGIITAAAVVLILAGVLNAMQGVVALATNEFYVVTQKWLFQFDVTTWGWVHILLGLIAAATGVALLTGAFWARTPRRHHRRGERRRELPLAAVLPGVGIDHHCVRRVRHLGFDHPWAGHEECVTLADSPAVDCASHAGSCGRSTDTAAVPQGFSFIGTHDRSVARHWIRPPQRAQRGRLLDVDQFAQPSVTDIDPGRSLSRDRHIQRLTAGSIHPISEKGMSRHGQ